MLTRGGIFPTDKSLTGEQVLEVQQASVGVIREILDAVEAPRK